MGATPGLTADTLPNLQRVSAAPRVNHMRKGEGVSKCLGTHKTQSRCILVVIWVVRGVGVFLAKGEEGVEDSPYAPLQVNYTAPNGGVDREQQH